MAALVWRHGRAKSEAVAALGSALASGHGGAAKWDGGACWLRPAADLDASNATDTRRMAGSTAIYDRDRRP